MKKVLFALVLCFFCGAVQAEVPTADPSGNKVGLNQPQPSQPETKDPLSLEAKIDFPTAYYFRGYKILDRGFQPEPEARLSYTIYDKSDLSITPYAGVWNNFNTSVQGTKNWKAWNELDVNAGATVTYKNWSVDLGYTLYSYPSGFSRSTQEIGFNLSYDDTDLSKSVHLPFALQPHVAFYHEINDQADHSNDGYLELGITPEFKLSDKLSFTTPLTFGNSTDHYYRNSSGHDQFFGYVSIGVDVKYQLTDHWYVHGGVSYANLFASALRQSNGGSSNVVIGNAGVGFSL